MLLIQWLKIVGMLHFRDGCKTRERREYYWVIKDPAGNIDYFHIGRSEWPDITIRVFLYEMKSNIKSFNLPKTWEGFYWLGWRCVKVRLVEVE